MTTVAHHYMSVLLACCCAGGLILKDWEIGIIVGASVGICCIIVSVVVVLAMNR